MPSYSAKVSLDVKVCLDVKPSIRFYNYVTLPLSISFYILFIVLSSLVKSLSISFNYCNCVSFYFVRNSILLLLSVMFLFNSSIISYTFFILSSNYFYNLLYSIFIPPFSKFCKFILFYNSFLSLSIWFIFLSAFSMSYLNFSIFSSC